MWEPVCTWLVLLQAESEADSSHPSRHRGAVVPIAPVQRSILLFNKSIFAAASYDFLRKGYFPVKMPTQSGNNRADPASEEFEKVKESLQAIWETRGHFQEKENASVRRRNTNTWTPQPASLVFGGKQRRCIPGSAGKQRFGEKNGKAHFVSWI